MKDASLSGSAKRPPNPFLVALFLGLAAGLAEVALLGVKKFALHHYPIGRSAHHVWEAPASLALVLVVVAVPFWAFSRTSRRDQVLIAGMGVLSYLAALDVLFLASRLHWASRVILAAGLATTFVRIWRTNPDRYTRWIRRGTLALASIVVLLGVGVSALSRIQEARRDAALPRFDAAAPSVLLLILDTVRSANMSVYGYPRPTTPELMRLASRGVVFDRAISPSSWTLPSHASMFTGRWAAELNANWRIPLDARDPTIAEIFSRRGYRTAGFVANLDYATVESGLARGFAHYEDYRITIRTVVFASTLARHLNNYPFLRNVLRPRDLPSRKTASLVRRDVERWVSAHGDRPYFAFVNFFDAHHPYLPPPPYDTLFTGRRLRPDELEPSRSFRTGSLPSPEILRNEEAMYDGSIAYIDAEVGSLLKGLDAAGALSNTIIIVTSDHGEEFGEHGLISHGHSLYLQSLRVPLIIVSPRGVPAGVRVPQWISLRDLPATILDLAGAPRSVPGRSLARYWNGTGESETLFAETRRSTGLPPSFPVSKGNVTSALGGSWHLIKTGARQQELFDLATDSLETRDRSRDAIAPLGSLSQALQRGPSRARR